jgi:hypothetical protein
VTATFNRAVYSLSVYKAGAGSGVVASVPAGISCGADCSEAYAASTVVVLSAQAAAGSVFTGWSGACSGTGTCSVAMSSAKAVNANFGLKSTGYTLTVDRTGSGDGLVTSSPAGISCGSSCAVSLPANTIVQLSAAPSAGSGFRGWNGACAGMGPCRVTMSRAKMVTARFEDRQRYRQRLWSRR